MSSSFPSSMSTPRPQRTPPVHASVSTEPAPSSADPTAHAIASDDPFAVEKASSLAKLAYSALIHELPYYALLVLLVYIATRTSQWLLPYLIHAVEWSFQFLFKKMLGGLLWVTLWAVERLCWLAAGLCILGAAVLALVYAFCRIQMMDRTGSSMLKARLLESIGIAAGSSIATYLLGYIIRLPSWLSKTLYLSPILFVISRSMGKSAFSSSFHCVRRLVAPLTSSLSRSRSSDIPHSTQLLSTSTKEEQADEEKRSRLSKLEAAQKIWRAERDEREGLRAMELRERRGGLVGDEFDDDEAEEEGFSQAPGDMNEPRSVEIDSHPQQISTAPAVSTSVSEPAVAPTVATLPSTYSSAATASASVSPITFASPTSSVRSTASAPTFSSGALFTSTSAPCALDVDDSDGEPQIKNAVKANEGVKRTRKKKNKAKREIDQSADGNHLADDTVG